MKILYINSIKEYITEHKSKRLISKCWLKAVTINVIKILFS